MPGASLLVPSAGLPHPDRLRRAVVAGGYRIAASTTEAAAAIVGDNTGADLLSSVQKLKQQQFSRPIILVTEHGSEQLAAAALHAGVAGYLSEPWSENDLLTLLDRLQLPQMPDEPHLAGPELIGKSREVADLREYIRQVAATDCSVLILGETGTGKELVAECIHANSPRRDQAFVCLNSAAIPDSLVESELFGYEKGAFTGAAIAQVGKLAFANHGTVFLDEIGDVGPGVQCKLLRAIESRQVYRLGSNRPTELDIRLVAGTNQDLAKAMDENRFRRDLYYRLNVVRLELPPLRDRPEDIPLLVRHFFEQFNRRWKRCLSGLSSRALDALMSYDWPGNVRELRNFVEALFASLSPEIRGIVDVPPQVLRQFSLAARATDSERDRMLKALISTDWNKSKASEQLHWSRMTFYRKMHKYQLSLSRD